MRSKVPGPPSTGCARVALGGAFVGGAGVAVAFMAAGVFAIGAFAFEPLRERWASRGWSEASCTIVSSAVAEEIGNEGERVPKAAIRYAYEAGGKRYEGNRVVFGNDWSRATEIVSAHSVGSRTSCFHDPLAPERAVLIRALGTSTVVVTAVGSVLFLAGAGALALVSFSTRQVALQMAEKATEAEALASAGTTGLPRAQTPRPQAPRVAARGVSLVAEGPAGGGVGFALGAVGAVWNVFTLLIMGPMVYLAPAPGKWFVALFAVPFLLVGFGLMGFSLYQWLKSMNPRPVVTLARAPHLGERCAVEWRLEGRSSRIRRLVIVVEGLERAHYTRGTSTFTDERVFFTKELLVAETADTLQGGTLTVAIPSATMPSFASKNNAIVWRVRFSGEIPSWPDLAATLPFEVLPPARSGAA